MKRNTGLPKLVVFGDSGKESVAEAIEQFAEFARGKAEIIVSSCIEKCTAKVLAKSNFAIVFGGDGTIISAARELSKAHVPVVGVNLGKLGFLAEFSRDELERMFEDVVSGKTPIESRMMLSCRVFTPFRLIELKIAVDGQTVASCVGDGLIISTPTGSTAYNISAGGPILAGNMEAMVITPICPHSLSFRPIVIDAACTVEVSCVRVNEGTTMSIDGQVSLKLSADDVVKVRRDASTFLIVNNPLRTRWETLATKLSWAEKPKYKQG
jgi:NAD+ kinase